MNIFEQAISNTQVVNAIFTAAFNLEVYKDDQENAKDLAIDLAETFLATTFPQASEGDVERIVSCLLQRYMRTHAPGHAKRINLDTLERYYQNISVHFMRGSSPMLNGHDIQSAKLDSLDGSILLTITLDGEDDVQFIADCTAAVHGNTSFISRNTNAQPDEIKS